MLTITDLSLTNISRFEEFTCRFSPGLNIVVGPNGSGKTSLLDAIYYGLYSTPRNRLLFLNVCANRGELTLNFRYRNESYTINKVYSREGAVTRATLKDSTGQNVAYGVNQIKDWISDAIGSEDSAKWYLRQGEVDKFISYTFAGEITSLCKLLGLGRISTLPAEFSSALLEVFPFDSERFITVSSLYTTAKTMEEKLVQERDGIFNQFAARSVDDLVKRSLELERQISILSESLKMVAAYEALKRDKEKLASLEARISEILDCQRRLSETLRNLYGKASSLLGGLPDLSPSRVEEVLDGRLPVREVFLDVFRVLEEAKSAKKLLDDIRHQETILQDIKADYLSKFRLRPSPSFSPYDKLTRQKHEISFRLDIITKILSEVSTLDSCPVCLRPLGNLETSHLREESLRLSSNLAQIESRLSELSSQIRTRQTLRTQLRVLYSRAKEIRSFLGIWDSQSRDEVWRKVGLIDRFSELAEDVLKFESEIRSYHSHIRPELDKLLSEKEKLHASISLQESKLGNMEWPSSEQIQGALLEATQKRTLLTEKISRLREIERQLDLYRQQQIELSREFESLSRLQDFHPWARQFVSDTFLSQIETILKRYVNEYLLPEINSLCKRLDLPFYILSEVEDGVLQFYAQTSYGRIPVVRLSYGQRVMLSVITVFVLYIHNNVSGILLADEPTAGLDRKNVSMLLGFFNVLHELCLSKHIQCIMTTHEYSLYSDSGFNIIDLSDI